MRELVGHSSSVPGDMANSNCKKNRPISILGIPYVYQDFPFTAQRLSV